jgi:uroporphyrin-III C-methyltransferase
MSEREESEDPSRASDDAAVAATGTGQTDAARDQPPAGPRSEVDAAGRAPGRLASLAVPFTLMLAVLAVVMTGFLWWQYRQFYVSLDAADAATATALEDVRATLRRLQDRLDTVDADLDGNRRDLARLERAQDDLPPRLAAIEERIDAVQGGSFDARSAWLRAEATYYLETANAELELGGDWGNAIAALELADDRLRQVANPALAPVRAAIADELIALRAVRLPDIEGLAFSLGRLAERVDELPMRAERPRSFDAGRADLESAEPGLGRLWAGIKGALSGLVRIERRQQGSVEAMLSDAERRLARRQLVVELELARLAAIRGRTETYAAALGTAIEILRADFVVGDAAVDGAIELLDGMREFDLDPDRPDISGSLQRLRSLSAGDD